MGTISDKLMRIINTKEDIRQALISKGYDVPTSIPFKEYAKMILDLPCNADSFPDIEGIVARYSASGLTNEQMAANPVWVDKTGNGRDLQLKNFSWKRMSGVGGYVQDFNDFRNNATVDKIRIDEQGSNSIKVTILTTGIGNAIYIPKNIYQFNKSYFIKISSEGYNEGDLSLSFYAPSTSTATTVKVPLNPNGITEIHAIKEDDFLAVYLTVGGKVGSITIEQLPLYPGALVFDGVDDYGVCENFPILTKEKGYTVVALRQWITYNPNAISAIATNASDQSFNGAFTFENYNKGAEQTISYGATQITLQYSKSPFSWQTTSKYNGVNIANGNKDATNSLVLGRSYPQRNDFANFAIWELVFLDHDATEEELTKIKDYFVKTYPWLFPDQAWTVTGKTNEDEDRATIANITGNGNDLVLSNFGFAEGSGYGLYAYNFNSFNLRDNVVKPTDVKKDSFRMIGTGNSNNVLILLNESDSADWKIRITGMKDGDHLLAGNANKSGDYIKITKDGVYTFQKQYAANATNGIWYNSSQEVDVLVEQIPEYEGYLVTDGVDDIASSNTVVYEADFTFIGEWKFIQKDDTVAGINSSSHLYIRNRYNRGATVMINSTFENKKNITDYMTFKAITSKGKGYDENWNEVDLLYGDGNKGTSGVNIGGQGGTEFCHMIFKNMALYMNKVFTKDECIKAYNYLQTLKAK
nr:MAG: hypothetical protein [Bacteriophage sp.]